MREDHRIAAVGTVRFWFGSTLRLDKLSARKAVEKPSMEAHPAQPNQTPSETEASFRLLAEASTDLISRHAPDGTYLYASPAAYTLLGYQPEELIGRSAYEFFHPDDLATIATSHQTVLETPATYTVAYRVRRKDGTYIWFETTSRTIRDAAGEVQAIYNASRDISRRKAIEERLRESEARFRSAFDNAAIGMAMVTPEGNFLRINRSFCTLVGYSEAELLQTDFQSITHPDDREADLALVQSLLDEEREAYQMEKRYLHKRGNVVWVLLNVSLVRDEAHAPLYFISQIQDITVRKQVEEALRAANVKLRKLVTQDGLTGLLNHRTFNERLAEEVKRATRHHTPLSLLLSI